ncbi:MAG: alpha-ribazole phosphatase [Firmicutes bacterium HGW-Firmicutes-14]|jgi:alpha-ribazole phosphatase|nr:MAG: alpha-ribazole phosphatase [Firmicutes bacterium HGW-Firmicutes-14]
MEQVTRLYLVRHGETQWNRSLRYQGHRDIPLSEEGYSQAQKIARRLSREKLEGAYASDLSRALETAKVIAGFHGLKVKAVPQLKETNFGLWEGLTYSEIDEQFHEVMKGWRSNPRDTKIPGGESLGEVADRCRAGLEQVVKENKGKSVLVVAHGGIIRIAVATVLGMDLNDYWKIKQDNVSLNIIEYYEKDRAILCLLNDTAHLGPECL